MKKQFILALVCLLLSSLAVGCGSAEATKTELKTFTPEGKNFTVAFPGEPTVDSFTVESPYGQQLTDTYMLEGKTSMQAFTTTVMPEEVLADDLDTVLTNSANGALGNINGGEGEITDITILDTPAKSFKCTIATPEGPTLIIEGHIVIIEGTLYQMQYMADEKNWDKFKDEREGFFNSFVINK
jgi:hypothetical protein